MITSDRHCECGARVSGLYVSGLRTASDVQNMSLCVCVCVHMYVSVHSCACACMCALACVCYLGCRTQPGIALV